MANSGRVVNITNLPLQAQEIDLLETLVRFGPLSYVHIGDPGTGSAEFEESHAAQVCLATAQQNGVFMAGQPLFMTPSPAPFIPRLKLESTRPTNVLIIRIRNVAGKTVTTKTIRAVCEKIAPCVRIAIHRESEETFALVEFGNTEHSYKVKQKLSGASIFTGCCTLHIDYAKLTFVKTNSLGNPQDNWDSLAAAGNAVLPQREGLLGEVGGAMDVQMELGADPIGYSAGIGMGAHANGRGPMPRLSGGGVFDEAKYGGAPPASSQGMPAPLPMGIRGVLDNGPYGGGGDGFGMMPYDEPPTLIGGRHGPMMRGPPSLMQMQLGPMNMPPMPMGPPADGTGHDYEGGALIGFGFPERANCDHVFNIFCVYGNVARIMFLRNKDACLVQMGDRLAGERALQYLQRFKLFGKAITFRQSQTGAITPPTGFVGERADGTPVYKEYVGIRANRFLTLEAASKNRLPIISETLFFYNCPGHYNVEQITELFTKAGAAAPQEVHILGNDKPGKGGEPAKAAIGRAVFANEDEATDALALVNNLKIEKKGSKFPIDFKLAYVTQKSDPFAVPPNMRMPDPTAFGYDIYEGIVPAGSDYDPAAPLSLGADYGGNDEGNDGISFLQATASGRMPRPYPMKPPRAGVGAGGPPTFPMKGPQGGGGPMRGVRGGRMGRPPFLSRGRGGMPMR